MSATFSEFRTGLQCRRHDDELEVVARHLQLDLSAFRHDQAISAGLESLGRPLQRTERTSPGPPRRGGPSLRPSHGPADAENTHIICESMLCSRFGRGGWAVAAKAVNVPLPPASSKIKWLYELICSGLLTKTCASRS